MIFICLNIYNYFFRLRINETYKYTPLWETIYNLNNNESGISKIDDMGVVEVIDVLFYNKKMWDKLPLSKNFKDKFHSQKNIIKKYDIYEHISCGRSYDFNKKNVIRLYCIERDNIISLITGKNISTIYYFEYILDDNNQLDDLILLKEEDIDSMTAETYAVREYE